MQSLGDFSLYLPEVWLELFGSYNEDIWPLHIVMAIFGPGLLYLATSARPAARNLALLGLGGCWLFVAVAYHYQYFTSINWMAYGFAVLCMVQGLLLIVLGAFSRSTRIEDSGMTNKAAIVAILLIALAAVPIAGIIDGRHWGQIDLFGVGPDSTALVTTGFLLSTRTDYKWGLIVIPTIWLFVSFATTWPFGMVQGLVGLSLVILFILFSWIRNRSMNVQ